MAKICDFGLSTHDENQLGSTIHTLTLAGTEFYLDPEYLTTGKLKTKSDVYSFGVVMLEIMCGKLAYDTSYSSNNDEGLASVARKCFKEGTIKDLVDPRLMEVDKNSSILIGGVNEGSLDTFTKVAYQCVAESQEQRPTLDVVIEELEKSLILQTNSAFQNSYRLQDMLHATNNFSAENLITKGGLGNIYRGRLTLYGKLESMDVVVRRLDCKNAQGGELVTEISVLSSHQHKNIISPVGYCIEDGEKIIIYENACHGSLNQHLSNPTLTWFRRLQICLGVARTLSYIHYDVIHCDISSSKILLDEDWEPKIYGFEHSTKYPQSWRHRLVSNKNMTPKNDVYSFGLLLFEVVSSGKKPAADHGVIKEELDGIIYSELGEQMEAQSWDDFRIIIDNCLNDDPAQRPTMNEIVKELDNVFQLQWKHENYEDLSTAAEEVTSSSLHKMERLIKIPLSKINEATKLDEDHFVGRGGYANVYKGELDVTDTQNMSSVEDESKDELPKRKRAVAIKFIIKREDNSGIEGFEKEIELLSRCEHPNIISLLGFCIDAGNMFLVYEYATKGSLSNYLGITRKSNLPWAKRLEICLGIANGIKYLHTKTETKPTIIHRDIKSENILLDENLNVKLADFGLSTFHFRKVQGSSVFTDHVAGTSYYTDPEYDTSFKYKKETDIYSFGVVLFEIMCGRLAYDPIYTAENVKGLAYIARRCFHENTIKELIDLKMMEEDDEDIVTLNRGPNQESLDVFTRIAYICLAETQAKRPTIEVIIDELHNALKLQGETMILSRFWLDDILLATRQFSENCIGLLEDGMVCKAKLKDFDNKSSLAFKEKNESPWKKTPINVAIKRIYSSEHVKQRFFSEIEMRTHYNHPNIVSLIGFCDEGDENILVYEHALTKSLNDYLKNVDNMDNNFIWIRRLQMCLGIAHGIHHLHTKMKMDNQQPGVIHGDVRSNNIFLGENWEPKIAYFGISEFHLADQDASNRKAYMDPEFDKGNALRKESDVYSFGVILLEVFCGRVAYDPSYRVENDKGLAFFAPRQFTNGTIEEIIDPRLKLAIDEVIFTPDRGPKPDSLDTFLNIAIQCLEEVGAKRPTMETVIKELEKALNMQENHMKSLQISLKDIELATQNFSQENQFGRGRYWEAYKGKLPHATVVAKRWDSEFGDRFSAELEILFLHKHKNIIGLAGYCDEENKKIIVYEHMSKGSLDKHLKDHELKWITRLEICIDVATALEYLHGGHITQKKVVHGDIKSHMVLLNQEWGAKISNFELSSLHTDQQDFLDRQKMDIYWFGVILFEILRGNSAWEEKDKGELFIRSAKSYYEQGEVDKMVFEHIKKDIVPQSLTAFADIAYRCLNEDTQKRPEASTVAIQLKKALEYQEDFEIWEPRLPRDYNEIMLSSETPELLHTERKKAIYQRLINGIALPKENVWYYMKENGMARKLVSPATFMFGNNRSHRWRSIRKRSWTAAKMLDISNLRITITIDTKFLTPDVEYGVYLLYKFCGPRKFSSKRMYTNLKYKYVTKTLHSYFATWDNDEWMMIELHRFINQKEVASFEFLLECFSRSYCPSGAIYIEGIQFRALKRMVAHEDMIKNVKGVKQVLKSSSDLDQQPSIDKEQIQRSENDDRWIQWESNGKKHIMLSASEIFLDSPDPKTFRIVSSADSSADQFQDVVEFLPQQVFRIKYKIEMKMLSKYTEYTCYLVFMISEACKGLHGPVRVRDLRDPKNKEGVVIYLRSPAPLNQHDGFRVSEKRKDGLMEVMVWNFNSMNNKHGNGMNFVPMNLKFITYEGNMSGLTVCGLECRPN